MKHRIGEDPVTRDFGDMPEILTQRMSLKIPDFPGLSEICVSIFQLYDSLVQARVYLHGIGNQAYFEKRTVLYGTFFANHFRDITKVTLSDIALSND